MVLTDLIRKLTSRKLWAALLLFAAGGSFTAGGDVSDIDKILDAACKVFAALGYILAEASVDAARATGETEPKISEEAEKALQEVCK